MCDASTDTSSICHTACRDILHASRILYFIRVSVSFSRCSCEIRGHQGACEPLGGCASSLRKAEASGVSLSCLTVVRGIF